MAWEIEVTDEWQDWYWNLPKKQQDAVESAVDKLADEGPALKRPLVGQITGQKYHHVKELRVGSLRVIFAFDPRQTGVLLLGGDKAQAGWTKWYSDALKRAVELYETYLAETGQKGDTR